MVWSELIHHDDRAGGELEQSCGVHVRDLGGRDVNKGREVAIVIQQGVQLDAFLGPAKLRPREHRQAQIDHRGIKRVELVLEMELLSGGQSSTAGVLFLENDFKKLRRALRIGIGQGRAFHRSQTQVVEPLPLSLELLGDITQTGDPCELGEHHRRELLPTVKAAILTPAPESLPFDPVENVSINKLEQLAENYVTLSHGLILLLYWWVMGKTTIPQKEISGLFSIP